MITDYFVCWGSTADQLRENVNGSIQKGWQPFGGVAVAIDVKWLGGRYGSPVIEEQKQLCCQAVVNMDSAN